MQGALTNQKAFKVKALAEILLGPNKDIPATTLELTPEFTALHKAIMDLLEREGATLKNPHYHHDSFNPHITAHGTGRVSPGEAVLIKDISIGTKLGEDKDARYRILATVDFDTIPQWTTN